MQRSKRLTAAALALWLSAAAGWAQQQPGQQPPPGQEVIELEFEAKPEGVVDPFEHPVFNEFVTLDFKDAAIQNVIRLIAARTNLNILMDPNEVRGIITLHLENVRLGHALDAILRTNKMAYIVDQGSIVRIVPQAAVNRSVVEVATEVIELNWRDATDIAATFRTFLSDHGSLQANEESQAVIITDVPPQIMRIRELIKQIDRPDRQVIIEARLVDVAIEAVRALGVTWSLANSPSEAVGGIGGGFPDVVGLFNDAFGFSGDSGGVLQFGDDLGFLGSDFDLNAVLNALETRDVVEVLENPRVTTLNNVPANIEIIRRIPYEEVVQGPSDASITREIEFENAGVTITVKPIIAPNGSVRLDMNLNQRIFRSRVGSGALAPPLIDVRNANSTVIVGDRNTVVLGGLRSFRSSDRITGVPWLHRIPFFGWAFKNKGNEQSRTELVLMVTPRIVEQALVTDYEKEYYDRIETKWDLPDYFMDDVRNITDKDGEGN